MRWIRSTGESVLTRGPDPRGRRPPPTLPVLPDGPSASPTLQAAGADERVDSADRSPARPPVPVGRPRAPQASGVAKELCESSFFLFSSTSMRLRTLTSYCCPGVSPVMVVLHGHIFGSSSHRTHFSEISLSSSVSGWNR